MTTKKSTSERKRAATKEQPQDEKPWKPNLCCCPPRITLLGSTSVHCCPLNNQMLDDSELIVRADANASVNPPGGPQVNADGSGGSEARTMLRKDVDLVSVIVSYIFKWDVQADCDFAVRVSIDGQVSTDMHCAPKEGQTELKFIKVVDKDEINSGLRGAATARVEAIDCAGLTANCELTLNEP